MTQPGSTTIHCSMATRFPSVALINTISCRLFLQISVLVSLLALQTSAASREKKPEKRPTKKASSVKPTKHRKSIVEEFNGLPPEDIDFIKELDKQFNDLGQKIKIKVQRDNSSDTKSTKRTIDGDLGLVSKLLRLSDELM